MPERELWIRKEEIAIPGTAYTRSRDQNASSLTPPPHPELHHPSRLERASQAAMAAANAGDVEVVDFDSDDDDLMDDDAPEANPASAPRLRSTIAASGDSSAAARKTKGRGFREEPSSSRPLAGRSDFDSLGSDHGPGPLRCKILWASTHFPLHPSDLRALVLT